MKQDEYLEMLENIEAAKGRIRNGKGCSEDMVLIEIGKNIDRMEKWNQKMNKTIVVQAITENVDYPITWKDGIQVNTSESHLDIFKFRVYKGDKIVHTGVLSIDSEGKLSLNEVD